MKTKISGELLPIIGIVIIVLFSIQFTACTTEPQYPGEEEAKTAVLEKIQAANKGWASGNTMVFFENAASDIVWIDDVGPSKRLIGRDELKTYLEGLKGVVPPHKHELYEFKFQYYGDIVIASYYYQGILEGEKATPWKAVSVFRYTNGDWFSVLEKWTEVVEEKKEEHTEENSG